VHRLCRPGGADAAATAAHYGSISIVTFVTATAMLSAAGIPHEGFMTAVAAAMETPAIAAGLILARSARNKKRSSGLLREVLLNGGVVLLLGAFAIGAAIGPTGMADVSGFFQAPFVGVLCLFLLDMGLLAAARLRTENRLNARLVAFGLLAPLVFGSVGLLGGGLLGLSAGGAALFAVLCGSASYIAVPAAMRIALPRADAGVYAPLSLGVTFPFNILIAAPIWIAAAQALWG